MAKGSAPFVEVKVEPTAAEMQRSLDRKRKELANFSPLMAQVAIFLDQWVQENFKTEGGKIGGWLPFKSGGRRLRNGEFDTSAKLLQDSGRLRASFLPFASKKDAGIGSKMDYSKAHQEGIRVPERRMLPLVKEVKGPIHEKFNIHVKRSLNKK